MEKAPEIKIADAIPATEEKEESDGSSSEKGSEMDPFANLEEAPSSAPALRDASVEKLLTSDQQREVALKVEHAQEEINMIKAQFDTSFDNSQYYQEFAKKFQQFADFPEIAASNQPSSDFFVDNMSSLFFQWTEVKEGTGSPVYLNKTTGEKTNKNPWLPMKDALKKQIEGNAKWFWIPDAKHVWLPGKQLSEKPEKGCFLFETADQQQVKLPESKMKLLIPLDRVLLMQNTHDLLSIVEGRDEAYILYMLGSRYYRTKIYTKLTERILISINPYRVLSIYSDGIIEKYKKEKNESMPPHVFQITKKAIEAVESKRRDQSIIIIGETGSGKTEACKECIKYISTTCKTVHNNMIELVMSSFPLLEAIGNAKNTRNNNSSRYGKWMQVMLGTYNTIVGCIVKGFLLEKSRVAQQNKGERNFHIFYYMSRGIVDKKERERLYIEDIDNYSYLNSTGCTTADTINDKQMWVSVRKYLDDLFGEDSMRILEIFSAVLLFGNVAMGRSPTNEDATIITSAETVKKISTLLQIDPLVISEALTQLKTEHFVKLFNLQKATDAKHACAKTLYSKLFDFIVQKINEKFKLYQSIKGDERSIGILDIYGFEVLESNSFEQLCINYANERLHQHFVLHTFKLEQAMYKQEGIDFAEVQLRDNEPIVKLIDGTSEGIMYTLEDEIRVPKGSDMNLLMRMKAKYSTTAYQGKIYEHNFRDPAGAFIIRHYTSPVSYKIANFLEKAKDEISWNILGMLGDSGHPIVKQLFKPSKDLTPEDIKGMKQNILIQYKTEINGLLSSIEQGDPYYIKCIIPNRDRLPMFFDHSVVREQLQANGVLETLEICHRGYAVKMDIAEFATKFKVLGEKKGGSGSKEEKKSEDGMHDKVKDLVQAMQSVEGANVKVGKKVVFMKEEEMKLLEIQRKQAIEKIMGKLLRCIKVFAAKRLKKKLRAQKKKCDWALSLNTIQAYDEALKESQKASAQVYEVSLCDAKRKKIVEEAAILGQLEKIIGEGTEGDAHTKLANNSLSIK